MHMLLMHSRTDSSYDVRMTANDVDKAKREAIEAVAQWADKAAAAADVKLSKLATMAGIHPSTVTRGMAPDSTSTPKLENLHLVARAAKIPSVIDFLRDELEVVSTAPVLPSVENLVPLLKILLSAAPSGRASDASVRALSEALAYALELLGDRAATPASDELIGMAARGAMLRFRAQGNA